MKALNQKESKLLKQAKRIRDSLPANVAKFCLDNAMMICAMYEENFTEDPQ